MNDDKALDLLSKVDYVVSIENILAYDNNLIDNKTLMYDLHSFAQSKYGTSNGFSVSKELTDKIGITVTICTGKPVPMVFLKRYEDVGEAVFLKNKDITIFPSNFKYKIIEGDYKQYTFKLDEPIKYGTGKQKYKVSLLLQDNYFIDVYADNEDQAINTAYNTGMQHWTHEWPERTSSTRVQKSRFSMWNKSMLKASILKGGNNGIK